MANGQNIKNFTAADIEKYHQGKLSPQERHAMEKAALDDPFLADALEGYAVAGGQAAKDLDELRTRLAERTGQARVIPIKKKGGGPFPVLRVAAMIAVIAGAGYLTYELAFNNNSRKEVAKVEPGKDRQENPAVTTEQAATGQAVPADSNTSVNRLSTETQTPPVVKRLNALDENSRSATGVTPNPGTDRDGLADDIAPPPAAKRSNDQPVVATEKKNETVAVTKEYAAEKDAASIKAAEQKATGAKKIKTTDSGVVNGYTTKKNDASPGLKNADKNYHNQAYNTFRGRVTDANNIGLPFANVTNTRDNAGTYTDANGYFNLISPDTVLNVQVRSIGYNNGFTALRNDLPSNRVILQEDRSSLNEVVIGNVQTNAISRSREDNKKMEEPEPADGWTNYDAYLANNLQVPENYQAKPTPDTYVQLSFEVDGNGEPVNIRVEKSLCTECDLEAIRLVKEGPKWRRNARKKGRTTVTINF